MKEKNNTFERFFDIVKAVRKGCPWDREQTPLSLRSTFFEETCEAIDAISQNDAAHIKEELGDVLLNVILIAYLFEEQGLFTVEETINAIADKLVRRHPHVFAQSEGKTQVTEDVSNNPEKVLNQWERIKENVEGRKSESVLDSIPENYPPILKAYKELKKAAKFGFDWNTLSEVKMKFSEELAELHDAFVDVEQLFDYDGKAPFKQIPTTEEQKKAFLQLENEFGDTLHCLLNYGRWLGIDPNLALQKAMKKFEFRFKYVEQGIKDKNLETSYNLHREMMDLWNSAKSIVPKE